MSRTPDRAGEMDEAHLAIKVLLEAGRPVEAEQVFVEDLANFPENGWSLFGLSEPWGHKGKKVPHPKPGSGMKGLGARPT